MTTRQEVSQFLDELLLAPCNCDDSSNNGLQVEGQEEVSRIAFGVDACAALFQQAAAVGAEFVVVHHGLSWRDSLKYLVGLNARRVGLLFGNGISLYAAHLPLDQHPEVGHNAVIAERLGLADRQPFFKYGGEEIGVRGRLPEPVAREHLVDRVNQVLRTECGVSAFGPDIVASVGIVSGGAADAVGSCAEAGLDCLITGEMDHTHYHSALESGVNLLAAGHYRSEVPGLEAVMGRVSARFDVACEFIDIPTGY